MVDSGHKVKLFGASSSLHYFLKKSSWYDYLSEIIIKKIDEQITSAGKISRNTG